MKRIPVRLWDLPCVIFLLIAQLALYQRLSVTNWTSNLEIAGLLTVIGALLGLAFGASRFKPATSFWMILIYSLAVYPLLMGGLFNDGSPWPERIANLGGRLAYSFSLFVTQKPVRDPILFVTFISVCYWIISLTAGYSLTRTGNFLGAALPGGIVMFIIQIYDPTPPGQVAYLAVYLFLCLLLLGRLNFVRKRLFWREHQVWFSTESANDINLTTLGVAVLLIFLTWAAPASSQPIATAQTMWKNLTQPLEQARKDLGNAIAGLRGKQNAGSIDFYAADLSLGSQAAAGTGLVFTVRLPATQETVRYYWRVRTYDQYADGSWHTTATSRFAASPDRLLDVTDIAGILTSDFYFLFPQQNISTLITPTRTIAINRPSILTYFPAQDRQIDPVIFSIDPPLPAGQSYRVKAVVTNPTVIELRNAGTAYPDWVTSRYLQLPPDLPPSIPELARQITAGLQTPYDKARAITQYLRDNIEYVKTVPPTPEGQDTLAWFLFTYKAGYCNYYATAEVVLLRAVGVPARMAVGYAEGEQQSPFKVTVIQQDAHAWPEVYFPGLGWVEFEPTASQPPLERPSGLFAPGVEPGESRSQVERPTEQAGPSGVTGQGVQAPLDPFLRLVIILVVLVLAAVLIWMGTIFGPGVWISARLERVFRRPIPVIVLNTMERLSLTPPGWLERWAFFANLSPITRSFGVVYQGLRWLGAWTSPTQTPAEAASALTERLPAAAGEINTLLEEYQLAMYSNKGGDWFTARRAAESIRRQSFLYAVRIRLASIRDFFGKKR